METQQLEEKASDYVKIFEKVNGMVSDFHVASVIVEQIGKDTRCAMMNGNGRNSNNKSGNGIIIKNPEAPATTEQKWRLRNEGITFSKDITKGEASRLIDEAIRKAAA